jgi:hypothetical protein
MAAHASQATALPPSPLDLKPKPLTMRSLDYNRPAATEVMNRVRGEFVEMRGFSPTIEQAARLFALTTEECGRILRSLVQEGFLLRTSDGRYRLPA